MNKPPEQQHSTASHEEWELRVQEWLDGTANTEEAAAVQRHVAACAACAELIYALGTLDAELTKSLTAPPALGSQFDARIFSRIDQQEAAQQRARAAVRQSLPQEELAALRRAWHRSLLRILAVSCVLAVALGWIILSGTLSFLSPATIAVTVANVTALQWVAIGLAGGGIATVLTRWLQSS